jgi:hypothetical protein
VRYKSTILECGILLEDEDQVGKTPPKEDLGSHKGPFVLEGGSTGSVADGP